MVVVHVTGFKQDVGATNDQLFAAGKDKKAFESKYFSSSLNLFHCSPTEGLVLWLCAEVQTVSESQIVQMR